MTAARDFDGMHAALFAPGWPEPTRGLNSFAAAVSEWHARELPDAPEWARVGKVVEEAAELFGALLKAGQQAQQPTYRPERDYRGEAALELADVIIAAVGAAEALGVVDLDGLVALRWLDVGNRRIATAGASS